MSLFDMTANVSFTNCVFEVSVSIFDPQLQHVRVDSTQLVGQA